MEDNKEKDTIIVKDLSMAILFNNALKENGRRNNNTPIDSFGSFSKEELESIKKLTLENDSFRDISALKYCTNLKDLRIKSVNAKDFFTTVGGISFVDNLKYNYEGMTLDIQDYSVIENLESLEFLEIGYDSNLKKLDVSNLKNLYSLKLYQNENLKEVKGIEESEIGELTLYRNNLSHSIDMEKIIEDRYCDFKLDFDMYPEIKKNFPNILEKIDKYKMSLSVNWLENLSNLRTNELNTYRIDIMNEKAKEILEEVVGDGYTDIEKISAIYAYIIQNVKYDHEMLDAAHGIEHEEYKKTMNILSEKMETYLDRRQSSYNAILKNKSVCEGYSNMMHYLLSSVGVESKTVSCSNDVRKKFVGRDSNHSVIRVKLEDDWYYFDPTWDAGKSTLTNFMKTKEDFEKNHRLGMSEKDIKVPEKELYTKEELNETLNFVLTDREERKKLKEKIQRQQQEKENVTEKKDEKRKVENYKSEVSSRNSVRSSEYLSGLEKINMDMPHEHSKYYGISDIDDTIFRDRFESKIADEFLIDALSNRYSRGASPERAKLIREFTELEFNAKFEDFDNPYSELIDADNKQILELEKVEGISLSDVQYLDDYNFTNIEELPKDISLKNEMYIATYDMEMWDPDLNKHIWKPVKEYYVKDEEGKLEKIGTGTYEKTTLNIYGHEIEIENENIEKKDTIDKVEQQYMAGNLLRSNIEDSMEEINAKGKITNILQITDVLLLDDLAKQCGIEDMYDLADRTFIVSTVDEKGNEDFDIIVRNNWDAKTPYEHLKGMYKEEVSKDKANIQSRYDLEDGDIITRTSGDTLKGFVTESGNRYVLTNIGGNIQFSEIYMENEKQMEADLIDTYLFKQELYDAYEDMNINKEDIDRAYDVLNRTREERELYNSDKAKEQEDQELEEQEL